MLPGVSFQVVGPEYLTQNGLILIRQKTGLDCRANIIRTDRRNLLKLVNKHLGKHIISIFIHEFISLHYYYLIVTFLYYHKCAKTHLQQCINLKKFRGPPALRWVEGREVISNAVGEHIMQEEGETEGRGNEGRGGPCPQKLSPPSLNSWLRHCLRQI